MGTHSNLTKKECWSCAYFTGCKKVKGVFLVKIETDNKGICTCKKSIKNGKEVLDKDHCLRWERSSLVEKEISKIEKSKATYDYKTPEIKKSVYEEISERIKINKEREKIEFEKEQLKKERNNLETEKREFESERKKKEYNIWYSSLSQEEKAQEDLRKERLKLEEEKRSEEIAKKLEHEKQEEERKRQERIRLFELEKERIKKEEEIKEQKRKEELKKKKKKIGISLSIVIVAIILIVIGVNINNNIKEKKKQEELLLQEELFNNSETGKLKKLLEESKDGFYYTTFIDENGNTNEFFLEYKKNGFNHEYVTSDFRASLRVTIQNGENITKIIGIILFNLEGTELENIGIEKGNFIADVYFGESNMIAKYSKVLINSNSSSYNDVSYSYNNWNVNYNEYVNEATELGFDVCNITYKELLKIYKEVEK